MSNAETLTAEALAQFTGSEQRYRDWLNYRVVFTEGVKYLADKAGAYWLLNTIAIWQLHNYLVSTEAFQVWTLAVRPDHSATLTCEDGNGNKVLTQELDYTDFPLAEVELYVTDSTILLPSEY